MDINKIKTEHVIYIFIFSLALFLRLFNLGLIPLNGVEAGWALRAYQVSQGSGVDVAGQPAYVLMTSLLLTLFGSNDALVRFLPALAGSALVWLPFLLRYRLGRIAAILVAIGLALDPGLVSLSRQAGSPMLALVFTLFSIAVWLAGAPLWAGALAGLSLLSGAAAIFGWVVLGITLALLVFLSNLKLQPDKKDLQTAFIAAAAVLILAGTLFLRYPQGITGIGEAVWSFISGFGRFDGASLLQLPLALGVYQPLALLFAVIALRLPLDEYGSSVSVLKYGVLASLFFLLIYPSRQVSDLMWAIVLLWGLAGTALSRLLPLKRKQYTSVVWCQTALTFVLLVLLWINLSAITSAPHGDLGLAVQQVFTFQFKQIDLNTQNYITRWLVLFFVPLLLVLTTLMIGMGWSFREAIHGLVLGAVFTMLLYTFSVGWAAGQHREKQANELWFLGGAAGNGHQMLSIISDLSERNIGQRQAIDVIYQVDSDWLRWYLRDFSQARYSHQLAAGEFPSVVISPVTDEALALTQAYRGQSFSVRQYPSWRSWPANFTSWLVFRQSPTISENVILWVRLDLFPGDAIFSENPDMVPFDDIP